MPVTGTPGTGALYPVLSAGRSGLTKQSCALIDHLRSVDKGRVRRVFGTPIRAPDGAPAQTAAARRHAQAAFGQGAGAHCADRTVEGGTL
ncbi:MAG: hypothetical protein HY699_06785 [Deltaproteobacteria bacterium]|nr:hypothetical protein [Deltaproteobacteria bacterium]